MKKLISGFLVFLFQSIFSIDTFTLYADYARIWCKTYVYNASGTLRMPVADFDAVHELIQCSADRAALNLKAQDISLQMLVLLWQVRQNLLQTRLNPSHERPHRIDRSMCPLFDAYWDVVEEQERCSQRYAVCAEKVVNGAVLSHQLSKEAVKHMRAQARIYMIDALADVKAQLGGLYEIAFHKSREDEIFRDEPQVMCRGVNIGEFILSYVPNLAMQGFVQADSAHNRISTEGWQVLEKVQRIGNQVWHAIETSRYAFYQALLNEIDAHK